MRTGFAVLGLFCLSQAAPAVAAEPERLAPATKWNLHYDDDSCVLRRGFGPAEAQIVLEIRQFSPTDRFRITIAGATLEHRKAIPQVRFEPGSKFLKPEASALVSFAPDVKGIVYSASILDPAASTSGEEGSDPAVRDAREREITGLRVRRAFTREFTLLTGEMHAPLTAMRRCIDDLVTRWGIDAAAQKTLSRKAKPRHQAAWARAVQAAYPPNLLRQGKSGRVEVRMIVEPDGSPRSCHLPSEMADKEFGITACGILMKEASFTPALDAAGQPVASFFTTTVLYFAN